MKIRFAVLSLLWVVITLSAHAQLTESYSYNPNLSIPDGNGTGRSDSHTITGSAISAISSVTVGLNISGNFNGDLYVYLRHEAETSPGVFAADSLSVLLNRVGRTSGNTAGYDDSGFNITLADNAANGDVHQYRLAQTPLSGAPLTGTFEPDGRKVDPASVIESSSRTALLDVFQGKTVDGRWTLFAADLQSGGTSQINGWDLAFTAVPEPGAWATLTAAGLLVFVGCRRYLTGRKPAGSQ